MSLIKRERKGIIYHEINTCRGLIFTSDDKKVGKKDELILNSDTGGIQRKISVIPSKDYGIGGNWDYRMFRCIEDIAISIKQATGTIPQPLYLGSKRDLLKKAGMGTGGTEVKALNIFLKRMMEMDVYSTNSFKSKINGKNTFLEENAKITFYEEVIYEKENDDDLSGKVAISFGKYYLANLTDGYLKPFYRHVYQSIHNITSRRLFELLSLSSKDSKTFLIYSDICNSLIIKQHKTWSEAKRQLVGLFRELELLKIVLLWRGIKMSNGNYKIQISLNALVTPDGKKSRDSEMRKLYQQSIASSCMTKHQKEYIKSDWWESQKALHLAELEEMEKEAYAEYLAELEFKNKSEEELLIQYGNYLMEKQGADYQMKAINAYYAEQDMYFNEVN